jgi:hypothetical protein
MAIPVSNSLCEDNSFHRLPVCLSAEQAEWVQRRADALQVDPSQFIRYVLNRWMRAEQQHQNAQQARQEASAPENDACDAPPARDAAAPQHSAPAASSASKPPSTVIESLRRGLRAVKALDDAPLVKRQLPISSEFASAARSTPRNDPAAEGSSPEAPDGPDAEPPADSGSQASAGRSLFDILRDAPDA